MKLKTLFMLLPVLALIGCSESPRYVDLNLNYLSAKKPPVESEDKRSQAMLAETASSVNQSLQQLSAIQLATHPDVRMQDPADPVALNMAQQTSLDWTGPVEPLLHKIAEASGYSVRVIGTRPAIPVIVIINAVNQPLANILRDTTYQIAQKARVQVYPKTRVIELRYMQTV